MPTAAPKQANNSQTARSQKKEIEVIRKFFYRVREKLVSDYELSEGSSKQKPFKNVLFHCNDYFFLFNAKDKFQLLEWSAFEEASKKPNFETCPIECTIQCDATTMIAIAEGEIRPMHAYLSGKLVVTGDKKAIRDYSPALLSAISRNIALEVRNKAGLTVEVLGVVGSGKGAESSPTTGENLSAHNSHVLKYSASNATSNGNSSDVTLSGHQYPVTNHSSQAQYGVVADTIVRYVFQVYDHYTHEKWQIIHRYSDFLKLRQDLLQQGFTNIPTIHTKSSFFYNQLEIINDRIIQLPLWLNQTIDIVMDYVTSKQGKEGNSPPQRSSMTLDDFLQNNSKGNFYIQQSSSIRKQKDLEESLKSVLIHNYSKGMITWNKRLMNNSRFILTEIQQLKLQIKHLEVVQSNLSSSSSSQSAFASMFQLNNESHSSEGEMRPKIAAINTASAPTNSNNLTSGSIPLGSSKNGGRLNILLQGVFGLLMFIFAELFVEEYCNHPLPFISFFHHHPIAPTASSYPIVSHWLERIQWMLSFDFFRGMFVRIMFLYYGLMNRSNRRAFVRYILLIIFLQSLFHHGMQVIVQTLYVPVSSSETSSAAASSTSHDEWRISTFTLRRFFILLMERSFTRTLQKIYVMYTNISIEINDLFHFPSISHLRTVITPYLAAVVSIATNANTSNAIDDAIESNNNAIEEVSNYDYYFRLLFSKLSLFLLIMIVLFYSYFQKQKTFQRNFQIYFHGFLLLIIYGFLLPLTCKTICKMIRIVSFLSFSSSTSSSSSSSPSSPNSSPTSNHDAILTQQIYDIVDSYIAPYFLYQIHSYRSIFIKFAQYFGTRSDMLLSDTWMTLLKELHDSCKASSFESYIRPQIEQEINELYEFIPEYSFTHQGRKESQQKKKRKTWWTRNTTNTAHNTLQLEKEALWIELEDIFDYFDHQCVASASIGQVHFGTINVRKLDKIRLKQQPSQQQDEKKRVTLESLIREEKYIYAHDITHPYFSMYSNDHPDYLKQAMKQSEEIESSRSGNSTGKRLFTGSKGGGAGVVDDEFHDLINVAVKIQHDQVDQIMMSDLKIVKYFVDIAQGFDSRWNTMSTVINSWEDMLQKELNFQQEGRNIREVHKDMKDSQLGVITPYPINGLVTKKLLVMTCLHGYKITDRLALSIYEINREALLIRIAHALSYQLLVSGTLNADPHPGNLLFCLARRLPSNDVSSIYDDPYAEMSYDDGEVNLSTKSRKYTPENSNAVVSSPITSPTLNSPRPNGSSKKSRKRAQTYDNAYDDSNGQVDSVRYQFISGANADNGVNGDGPMLDGYHVVPGFLDFGMTIRIKTERRKLYCRLIIALFEKDLLSASKILQELGYKNTQSDRAPERDAEFFEYLFRDATTKANSVKESERFTEYRKRQKQEDMEKGVYEKNGRSMAQIPEDFLFVSRVIGCLRGLTAELDCHCPILYIMALHAKVGLHV